MSFYTNFIWIGKLAKKLAQIYFLRLKTDRFLLVLRHNYNNNHCLILTRYTNAICLFLVDNLGISILNFWMPQLNVRVRDLGSISETFQKHREAKMSQSNLRLI